MTGQTWIEHLPVPTLLLEQGSGRVTFANRAARDLVQTASALGPLDDVLGPGAARAAIEAARGGSPVEHFAPDDGVRRFELAASADPDTPGVLIVSVRDVTDERRATQEIADLARFPEKNPGPVLWLDQTGKVLLANAAARTSFGTDGLVGSCWLDICPGLDRATWDRLRSSDDVSTAETAVGDTWFSFAYVRSDAGAFVFVFGTDITRRREMEQQITEYARFPDMNPGPVLRLDLAGTVLLANAAARAVFDGEVIGSCWLDTYPGAQERWDEIVAAEAPISLEAHLGARDYVFAHRSDPATDLVFVFGADITHQKQAEQQLRQSEKMATLGTLVAGVAHELNNPAAATRRAADQLADAFGRLQAAQRALTATGDRPLLERLDALAHSVAARPSTLGALARSDREADVEDWLDDHDVDDNLDLATHLVELDFTPETLDELSDEVGDDHMAPVLQWLGAAFPVYRLAHEIGEGSARISEIVGALKGYSYLGQAPVQDVDIHEGIDNTLIILRNKLKAGIDVERHYDERLPKVTAFGSELNQVWTNLLDNAADAMGGTGTIAIRTSHDDTTVTVEISDSGPGIPPAILDRVFDPFFTTKEPGKGTGLGLATSYAIVRDKHHGTITVTSEPGSTCFVVRLPIDGQQPAPPPTSRSTGTPP